MSILLKALERGIRDIVFGTQDGLVSTLGVLTGIARGTGDHTTVVISGFVVVLVESLSMAAGSYLSSRSNRQYQEHLLSQERREIETNIDQEKQEILEMYRKRGYSDDEIKLIQRRLLSNKDLLLEDMAHKELGIVPKSFENPLLNAFFMGTSYILGGSVPVLPYLFIDDLSLAMIVSFAATSTGLFGMGAIKGVLLRVGWLRSGLEILLIAGSATILGYTIGVIASSTF